MPFGLADIMVPDLESLNADFCAGSEICPSSGTVDDVFIIAPNAGTAALVTVDLLTR